MKPAAIFGLILIAVGVVALVYGGITYTKHETVLDVGPIHATADRDKTIPLSPIAGGVGIIAGAALLVLGPEIDGGNVHLAPAGGIASCASCTASLTASFTAFLTTFFIVSFTSLSCSTSSPALATAFLTAFFTLTASGSSSFVKT